MVVLGIISSHFVYLHTSIANIGVDNNLCEVTSQRHKHIMLAFI